MFYKIFLPSCSDNKLILIVNDESVELKDTWGGRQKKLHLGFLEKPTQGLGPPRVSGKSTRGFGKFQGSSKYPK